MKKKNIKKVMKNRRFKLEDSFGRFKNVSFKLKFCYILHNL